MRNEPSRTAESVCFIRASDQRRPPDERIVDDPYARLFLSTLYRAALTTLEATGRLGERAEEFSPGLMSYVLTRHRFIDDHLLKALNEGAVEQVVILGAGYDTRAYRLKEALGDRTVYELDFPATGQRKAHIVSRSDLPQANVVRLEIDFLSQTIDEVLLQGGFQQNTPTFFVWEGVSMYLTREAVKSNIQRMRKLGGSGSQLAMDYWFLLDAPDVSSTAYRMTPNLLHLLGEPITLSLHPEDAPDFLRREGAELLDLADPKALQSRYIRDERRVYPACYATLSRLRPSGA